MSNDLFPSFEEPKKKSPFALILVSLLLVGAVIGGVVWYFAPEKKPVDVYSGAPLRDSVALMLAQPRFSGDAFREQMLGRSRMPWFSIPNKEFYFSVPEMSEEEFKEEISKYIVDINKIEHAKLDGDRLRFPSVSMAKSPETGYFFRTTLENLHFEPKDMEFQFERAKYTLSTKEMIDLSNNSQVYGGMVHADSQYKRDGLPIVFANHGIMVAKPGEPSLTRFVNDLLKDVPNNREAKIQALLDFVTNEIAYDYSEATRNGETLKRPNETLMSRRSDCSNKTILMASLLEQFGEDYLMLYCPRHITIAIPQGNFPLENNLSFKWDKQEFIVAETTAPGFIIGKSKMQEEERLNTVEYVQRPREKNIIFRVDTLSPLEFK